MIAMPDAFDEAAVAAAVRAYVKLHRATRAVTDRVARRLAEEGLTPTQLGVLEAILHKGPMSQRDLGRKVLTSPGNMTDVIDKLAARGLLRRERGNGDRRCVRVELTPCGRALIADLFPRHARDIAAAMAGLSAAEIEHLGDLLRRLGHAAAAPPPDAPLARPGRHPQLAARSFDIEQSGEDG
ncbi:MAG TPA: MarR family transcriptional regulator [Acetobacteraceae bacterium]|nr:MarR family transcriptional regulator [Acetobacteraceae bacterium]